MKHHRTRKAVSLLLSLLMAVQLLPLEAGAASAMEGKKAGDVLFNNGEKDRLFVSETAYSLAPGITEYVTYTNEPDGLNQNIDYFCEVDLSQAEVMTGYAGMENILEKKTINWRMQTVSGQVEDTQSYFTRSEKYADCTIAAALNADYYNMATGQPTGLLIIDGKVYNPSSGGYYFGIDKKSGKAVISNDKSDAALAELSYAVGGGSLLVKDGKVNVGNGGRNVTYSAIGIKPDGTVVYPDQFIPILESTGHIVELDLYIFEQVAQFLQRNAQAGHRLLPIAVNASVALAREDAPTQEYSEILEKHNISARMLEIELTETAVVSEYDRVKRLLSSFQSDGMQTSLDDFGAGGSLLNNMVDIPVNTIKLDKLFLTRCSSNARGTDFLREIVHLVKRLGYNVICEGIETEEQVQLLRSLDCDGAQGFWFSKAIPAEEFERRYLCD